MVEKRLSVDAKGFIKKFSIAKTATSLEGKLPSLKRIVFATHRHQPPNEALSIKAPCLKRTGCAHAEDFQIIHLVRFLRRYTHRP